MNVEALKTVWASLSGPTYAKLAALEAIKVAGPPRDVSLQDVENYLCTDGKIATMRDFVHTPPVDADPRALIAANYLVALIQNGTPMLITSDATTLAQVMTFLAMMTLDPRTGITADDASALLAMTASEVPWWQAHGFDGPINVKDLIAAGNLF